MRLIWRVSLFGALLVCAGTARAQSFELTLQQAQDRFNTQSQKDGDNGDLIRKCIPMEDGLWMCALTDSAFQKSVNALKRMNLINGRFSLLENIVVKVEGGKVSSLVMFGSRKDPANLFHYWGDVGTMIQSLDPSVTGDDVKHDLNQLGMMAGDGSPNLETPKDVIRKAVAVECQLRDSHVDDTIQCRFDPRY